MLSQWGFVLMLSAIAVIIPVAAITLGHFLGPRRPDPIKNQTYESGVETVGDAWVQFRAQYYLIGLIFLIFDVEVIFLYPWAVNFKALGMIGFVEMVLFIAFVLAGFFYVIKKGALKWE